MRVIPLRVLSLGLLAGLTIVAWAPGVPPAFGDDLIPAATIDGEGPGWRALGPEDFEDVNLGADAWTWKDGLGHCRGTPVGVIRTRKQVTNFELVAQWRHLAPGGNSGIFVWAPAKALEGLKPGHLPPGGIEVQVLDNGYTEQFEKQTGKKADWFTTHGDVFPVGTSKMNPFPPLSPDGSRSFPRERRSLGVGRWNHYYVRAVNGEIRLWVNGKEVSGGDRCEPASGFLCLESEGSPVEFKGLRIRELP
ncbi:hypothetical protein OJF2_46780 [Aquisphaera giovannonii]|uniref:3-keto-alpha-glucoside-1,2-lyase/3-keto-2-hydroxy-glucal hydratase domain-containing protein n=1 Tax=Aquisphaera giovannonii TaxID=406548 RepID=A0A5B9W6F2_9BACT|nr:DUF1080 domain-containing protein [Aquisphaera giovannonii]QEH36118.1 hypothetical protein OJF2_46780 [Aquisphaera giovannonii]